MTKFLPLVALVFLMATTINDKLDHWQNASTSESALPECTLIWQQMIRSLEHREIAKPKKERAETTKRARQLYQRD